MTTNGHDVQEHLRAASDAILLLLAEIEQLERHKRAVPPGDPRFDELARSVRIVSQALADFTEGEEAWARTAADSDDEMSLINDSANAPSLVVILDRWRTIERELDRAEPGSQEAARLFDDFERVRDEYLAAFRARHPRR